MANATSSGPANGTLTKNTAISLGLAFAILGCSIAWTMQLVSGNARIEGVARELALLRSGVQEVRSDIRALQTQISGLMATLSVLETEIAHIKKQQDEKRK